MEGSDEHKRADGDTVFGSRGEGGEFVLYDCTVLKSFFPPILESFLNLPSNI